MVTFNPEESTIKNISNIKMNNGYIYDDIYNYTGMVSIITNQPHGFGRYYTLEIVTDGQFFEGYNHGFQIVWYKKVYYS